ncbi:tetratricopeptide repeat protein [Paracoccus sediminicola]|uniref:tetratricopeptide repeat protein n=1 Tax=Paracoccus sediminicola TaxID=3017783 RepID=UPI0022F0CD1E|nr:tetratricopeptide repeat protein [Paracoccus sediminicola]WBU55557.1 tetratricopeptide repeat protein [Paracoccus sediminicola]
MRRRVPYFHRAVTAFATAFVAAQAIAEPVDPALFETLAAERGDAWMEAETRILDGWADTGSEALNMIQTRGETALDEGDVPAAIGHLTALVDHAPDHAMGYQLRGLAYWLNGDAGPAAADLARALEIEPKQYLALNQLAAMLEELGRTDAAIEALRRSLEIHPHQQDAIDAAARLDAEDNGTNI